jgi:hypothetical protein
VTPIREQASSDEAILPAELSINTTLPEPHAGIAQGKARQLNDCNREGL